MLSNDQQQRQQALNPSESFIVQAPAGSGKTELLIQRFLVLLQKVSIPDEILAITFTKKAANEMRLRILKALKQSADGIKPESAHAQLTFELATKVLKRDDELKWNLLKNPNQLRIQTIDALCSFLTKQLPLLAQIGSAADICDTPIILYEETVQAVLEKIDDNDQWADDIAALLIHLDNNLNKLHDLLITLLNKRDQWLPYLHFDADETIKAELEHQLNLVIEEHLTALSATFPNDLIPELVTIARFAANQVTNTDPHSPIVACLDLTSLPDSHSHHAWSGIAKILLTDNEWRKAFDTRIGFPAPSSTKNPEEKSTYKEFKERIAALIEKLQDNNEFKTLLSELKHLPDPVYHPTQWQALKALLRVLKLTAAQLRVTFQQHGQIDFIENAQAATLALGNEEQPTDLALALDYQIKHILIDEFQDTSITQYRLLEKLTYGWEPNDGRTLFIVGDPMQSIYRFREAEVGLFIRMREDGIHHLPLTPLVLSQNFRSTTEIVHWNNQHFQSIFPTFNDIATGAICFTPSSAKNETLLNTQAVTITGFESSEMQPQAKHIVDLIKKYTDTRPEQSIAILVRARQHLKAIIPAIKKAGISYRALEIDPLLERQVIQDLLSLTKALLYPTDRISWLAILRSPWCGLMLTDLYIIAGKQPQKTIYELLQSSSVLENLSSDGQRRLQRFIPIINHAITSRQRFSLRHWIEHVWHDLGGPACLSDALLLDDAEVYFQLLEELDQEYEPFNLVKLQIKMEKLYASATHQDTHVHLMTIHSAKGLEFDTVIIPHLESKGATSDNPLMLWMDRPLSHGQQALLLAPIHATGNEKDNIYAFISRQQQIKTDYELSRLLYVATTRAKQHLHLLFNTSKNDKGDYQVNSGSLLKKLWPTLVNNIQCLLAPTEIISSAQVDKIRHLYRLTSTWQHPIPNHPKESASMHQRQQGFLLPNRNPQIIGTTMHQLMQQISLAGINWWQNQSSHQQNAFLRYRLMEQGMATTDIDSSSIYLHNMLAKVLKDEMGLWILANHQEAQAEYPLTAAIEDKIKNVVIDRTFIDKDGTRWIIDYKTAIPNDENIECFIKKEKEKHLKQLDDYMQVFKLMESRPTKVGLYFTAIPLFYVV